MSTTIDDLLAEAAVPTSGAASFDVGAALRRIAADAAKARAAARDIASAARARQRLVVMCRWTINDPGAAFHIGRLAEEQLDLDGAAVYAALLYLTGHSESAQFWWQLAAGDGHRAAAYCLHLHHAALGETREAAHWRRQVTTTSPADRTTAVDEEFLTGLEDFAFYVRRTGWGAKAPTATLEMEVDRLADTPGACTIAGPPDEALAQRLRDFGGR
jgi:hypothetical protein